MMRKWFVCSLLLASVFSACADQKSINSNCGYVYNQQLPTSFNVTTAKNALLAAANRCSASASKDANAKSAKEIYKKQADRCNDKHAADCKTDFMKLYQPFCGYQATVPSLDAENYRAKYQPLFNAGNACAADSNAAQNPTLAAYYRAAADQCLQTNPDQSTTAAHTVRLCNAQGQSNASTYVDQSVCTAKEAALQTAKTTCNAAYDTLRKKYCSISGSGASAKVTCSP